MAFSRRAFIRSLRGPEPKSRAATDWISDRGREASVGEFGFDADQAAQRPRGGGIRLSSNENPLGPSDVALSAMESAFMYTGRYPMNATPAINDLKELIASRNGFERANVSLGSGSGEVLDSAVRAFTGGSRGLVTALPSYESPVRVARGKEVPLVEVPVTDTGFLDLEPMIAAASGAGLVFICNPNNPTATVHPATAIEDAVSRIASASPDTVILLDEAYHDYVTDPNYQSAMALVGRFPNLIVSRTFSKAHGMAGMRIGYAIGQQAVIATLTSWSMPYNVSAAAVAAAYASLEDDAGLAGEKDRNTAARQFTIDFFRNAGYDVTDSQTNFIFVKLNKPASEFRDACREQGIQVGRDFPPLEKTWARISIGTQAEMDQAVEVFKSALNI